MKINHCKTNHMENPLGFQMDFPVVSWKVSDTKAKRQVAAQVIVALDEEFSYIIYDTGKEIQLSNLGMTLDFELTAFTRYYWKVSVWNELGGMATSDINWFETGRKDVGWQAEWITPSWEDKNTHPYFRKSFIVDKSICSARIYATGLGLYELFLNEEKVGNEYFSPGCTAADAWIQSYTYDVTKHLKRGENILGSLLGNGWAKGRFGVFTGTQLPYTDRFSLLLELKIEYTDGTSELIKTDGSWSCAESPIIKDSI